MLLEKHLTLFKGAFGLRYGNFHSLFQTLPRHLHFYTCFEFYISSSYHVFFSLAGSHTFLFLKKLEFVLSSSFPLSFFKKSSSFLQCSVNCSNDNQRLRSKRYKRKNKRMKPPRHLAFSNSVTKLIKTVGCY